MSKGLVGVSRTFNPVQVCTWEQWIEIGYGKSNCIRLIVENDYHIKFIDASYVPRVANHLLAIQATSNGLTIELIENRTL